MTAEETMKIESDTMRQDFFQSFALAESLVTRSKTAFDHVLDRLELRAVEHNRLRLDYVRLRAQKREADAAAIDKAVSDIRKEWEIAIQQIEAKNVENERLQAANDVLRNEVENFLRLRNAASDAVRRGNARAHNRLREVLESLSPVA